MGIRSGVVSAHENKHLMRFDAAKYGFRTPKVKLFSTTMKRRLSETEIHETEPVVIFPFSLPHNSVNCEITMCKFLAQGEIFEAERIRDSRVTIHESDVIPEQNRFHPIFPPT